METRKDKSDRRKEKAEKPKKNKKDIKSSPLFALMMALQGPNNLSLG